MTIKRFILFLIILLAGWQIFYFLGVDVFELAKAYSVPSPIGVGKRFIQLLSGGNLVKAVLYSLGRGLGGYAIAVGIGTVFGLCIKRFPFLKTTLKPLILGVQTLPSICWVPFSILWFGLSTKAIIFVVVMGSAFSICISVDNSINNVLPIYKKAALTMGANKRQLYTLVIFPAALPEIVAGLKQGWAFAWRALMSGEVMTTSVGLGQTLIMGRDLADIDQVALVMVIIVMMGILVEKCIFSKAERKMQKNRGLDLT